MTNSVEKEPPCTPFLIQFATPIDDCTPTDNDREGQGRNRRDCAQTRKTAVGRETTDED